jgi:hypothetical protein
VKIPTPLLILTSVIVLSLRLLSAEDPIPNRLIDYKGFQQIVDSSRQEREAHRLSEAAFLSAMKEKDVVVLDARTASRYQMRHIKGAINLPFTEFAAAPLANVIPTKETKILIYCNNNFLGDPVALLSKAAPASLNLSTYISLRAYGYDNIYELAPLLNVNTTKIPFEGTELK